MDLQQPRGLCGRCGPVLRTHPVEALGEAALVEELAFDLFELSVQEEARLVYQADERVGRGLGVREVGRVGQVGPVRLFQFGPNQQRLARALVPLAEPALSQEVLVILGQFPQARACHVGQLDLHLLRCCGSQRALHDVLLARPRSLHHLVMGAAAPLDVSVAEGHRDIVDKLGKLKAFQVAVATMLGDQRFTVCHRPPRPCCRRGTTPCAPRSGHGGLPGR